MPLPQLIEIRPLSAPVQAEIVVPGSKSITNRALVLAALAEGETILRGALWSEDTQVMVDCLRDLGFLAREAPDPVETGNRTITIYGMGGSVPRGGTPQQPLELYVGNAGTAARFLAALVCLGHGVYRLHGVERMHERPQAALFEALRQLGYRIDSPNNKLPALIHGRGTLREPTSPSPSTAGRPGQPQVTLFPPKPLAAEGLTPGASPYLPECRVSIAESSQFASALILTASMGGWRVRVEGDNAEESPYVAMTRQLCRAFPAAGGTFHIEPDASSGSYFWAANAISDFGFRISDLIKVAHWPVSGWQMDEAFPKFLPLPSEISRQRDLGDSIMTAIVLAPLAAHPVKFSDLGRLRLQECERVAALRTELTKCGARVIEQGDTLEVFPSNLHRAEIETYQDHRLAMCFAVLGLMIPGMRLRNPGCVKKTFPHFFQKLASPPPRGLGVIILDATRQRRLLETDLLAD